MRTVLLLALTAGTAGAQTGLNLPAYVSITAPTKLTGALYPGRVNGEYFRDSGPRDHERWRVINATPRPIRNIAVRCPLYDHDVAFAWGSWVQVPGTLGPHQEFSRLKPPPPEFRRSRRGYYKRCEVLLASPLRSSLFVAVPEAAAAR